MKNCCMTVCVVMRRILLIGMKSHLSWSFVDKISQVWQDTVTHYPNYEAGTSGPKESDTLLAKDGYLLVAHYAILEVDNC